MLIDDSCSLPTLVLRRRHINNRVLQTRTKMRRNDHGILRHGRTVTMSGRWSH